MQAQEVAGRIFGAVAGEVLHQAYQVPIINSHLLHYIIRHLPLAFLSPTSKMFLEKHKNIFLFIHLSSVRFRSLFGCLCVRLFALSRCLKKNAKLCDFSNTNNNDFISTPIAPPLVRNLMKLMPLC